METMDEVFVVGDLAGNFLTFMALLEKIPHTCPIIQLGDVNDRGPRTKDIVNWMMQNSHRCRSILGNHEDMWLDFQTTRRAYGNEHNSDFLWNGGNHTLKSYNNMVPYDVVEWLQDRPLFLDFEIDGKKVLCTHAPPIAEFLSTGEIEDKFMFVWNRGRPANSGKYDLCLFGHNSMWGLKYFGEMSKPWAICLDTSSSSTLTGIHLPSMKTYSQQYID